MKRRDFLALAGGAVAGAPLPARAQQAPIAVGFLSARSPGESAGVVAAFKEGLSQTGFVEGRNITIAFRWAEGNYERLPVLAAELVTARVAVIFAAGGTVSGLAAKAATTTTPIVFSFVTDPIASGLVARLNRPGGNITGMANINAELGSKRLELLREVVPTARSIALLVNPSAQSAVLEANNVLSLGRTHGMQLHVLNASTENELMAAFDALAKLQAGAMLVVGDPFFDSRRERLVALAARHRIPAIYHIREFPAAGGLMSYGSSITDAYRQGGLYIGRILNGANPGDLPVMQPTLFELVINLKTAKALGITIPESLLARADEVIE